MAFVELRAMAQVGAGGAPGLGTVISVLRAAILATVRPLVFPLASK
jgi:hypothetical protein